MSINVFLADDHAVVRDGLRLLLESQPDITVVGEASEGRTAVRQVKRLQPDIVIVDIAMPQLNGIETVRQIRESSPSTHAVILSMYSTSEHILRALQAGALGYVLKESAGSEVINAVRAVSSGQRYLSQKIEDTIVEDYIRETKAVKEENILDVLSYSFHQRQLKHIVAG